MKKTYFLWLLQIVSAVIMLETLYFKFSAAPESVYIFSQIGMEPWGRIGIGIGELICSILILIPRTAVIGAIGGVQLMAGAVFFHLTKLGIDVQGDGGRLFTLVLIVLVSCLMIVFFRWQELILLYKKMIKTA